MRDEPDDRDREPMPPTMLEYGRPRPSDRTPLESVENEWVPRVFRRLGFVAGMTLSCYGLGLGLPHNYHAPTYLGWGGFFLGCTIPLGRR